MKCNYNPVRMCSVVYKIQQTAITKLCIFYFCIFVDIRESVCVCVFVRRQELTGKKYSRKSIDYIAAYKRLSNCLFLMLVSINHKPSTINMKQRMRISECGFSVYCVPFFQSNIHKNIWIYNFSIACDQVLKKSCWSKDKTIHRLKYSVMAFRTVNLYFHSIR